MACSWEGCLLYEASHLAEMSVDLQMLSVLPCNLSSKRGCGNCRPTQAFSSRRPCRKLRGKTMLLAVMLKPHMVKNPHNPRLPLRKPCGHLPLQTGATTNTLTADTGFPMGCSPSSHSLRGFSPWLTNGDPKTGTPCHSKPLGAISPPLKSTWTVLQPGISAIPKCDVGGYQEGSSAKMALC